MKKLHIFTSLLLAALLVFGQIGAAQAAPATQEDTPTFPLKGTVVSVEIKDLDTDTPYVKVEIKLEDDTIETLKLTLAAAEELGLVTKAGDTYTAIELDEQKPLEVEIGQDDVLPEEEDTTDDSQHPIGLVLEMFFGEDLGLTYDDIMAFHEDGVGFGVLAQAMWMTKNLEGAVTLNDIIAAKQNGNYSSITLPDGSTPKNWGQFRKAVLDKGNNLGATKDKDNGKPEDKGNGKNKDKGNGNNKP
jgi:hypothetical protein